MSRRSPLARFAVCAFAFALLLKAAVPMLASTSAALQGMALADVCSVYGVATVALPRAATGDVHGDHGDHGAPASNTASTASDDPHARHHLHHAAAAPGGSGPAPEAPPPHGSRAGESCVLTALLALSAPEAPRLAPTVPSPRVAGPVHAVDVDRAAVPDALALWASRLRHGPPVLS